MKKTSITYVLLLLVAILIIAPMQAGNFIYVNATSVPLRIIATFRADIIAANVPCQLLVNQYLEPGGVYTHSSRENLSSEKYECFLETISVDIEGQVRIQDNFRIDELHGGTFVIRPRPIGGYEIDGPFLERYLKGTLFLVNATGLPMQYYSEYHTIFCLTDRGGLHPGEVAELHIAACLTEKLYGYNIGGNAKAITNTYTGSTGNGTFVFRRAAGSPGQYEVIGPFKQ